MNSPILNLVVIRSAKIDAALSFYAAFGFEFERQQHGKGPVHYSCEMDEIVFEIYPPRTEHADSSETDSTLIGFRVESIEEILERLAALGIENNKSIKHAEWGKWINVIDPDGRTVQISERPK